MYSQSQRDLLRELVISQIQDRDQSSFLGFLWSFLHPLLLLLILYTFFNTAFGGEVEHYGIYMLIGLVHYTHFANTTSAALRSLRQMRSLTAETVFPKELLVLSSMLAGSLDYVLSIVTCLVIAVFVGVPIEWNWLWSFVIVALQLQLSVWVGVLLSALYPFIGDIDHVYQIFLRILFFATPIFYNSSFLSSDLAETVIALNPLAQLIAISRGVILEGRADLPVIVLFLLVNGILAWIALRVFRSLEPSFAENV